MDGKHQFLLEPGAWLASGHFWDANNMPSEAVGEAVIVHDGAGWVHDDVLRVDSDPPLVWRNRYNVKPLEPGERTTTWISDNPDIGPLYGTLMFMGNVIVSIFTSADGEYTGTEYLTLEPDGRYVAQGALQKNSRVALSWKTTLTRRSR